MDHGLRAAVSAVHETLARADDLLEAETRFAFVIERVRMALTRSATRVAGDDLPGDDLAEALRAYLDLHLFEPVTMAEASAVLGASPTRLARSFATVFGIPPHRYVLGRRMDAARRRILAGQPLANVAARGRLRRPGPPHSALPPLPRRDTRRLRRVLQTSSPHGVAAGPQPLAPP